MSLLVWPGWWKKDVQPITRRMMATLIYPPLGRTLQWYRRSSLEDKKVLTIVYCYY
jgi:hypothetical protein